MRENKEFELEQEDELFNLDKLPVAGDAKKTKPHVARRHVEDYLERKALERRLKDVFDDKF